MKIYVKKISVATFVLFISIFRIELLPQIISYSIRVIGLLYACIFIFIHKKSSLSLNISLLYPGAILVTTIIAFMNGYVAFQNVINASFYVLGIILFYEIIKIWINSGMYLDFLFVLKHILIFYCVTSFISALALGKWSDTLLWGNKFTTSYYFLFLLSILYCISEYSKRERDIIWWVKYIIYAVFTMLFEIWIGCTTVFVATILFFILIICKNKIKNIICKRSFVIISMIASGIVVNVMEYILLNEYVQNIIVGLLGENLSLTGRTVVYSRYLYPLIYDSIWFGHGFSNTMLYQKTNVFFNVQNGFFDVIVNYGLLGLLFLLATVWMCVGKEISRKYGWGLYVLIYSLILASIIEVSYNFIFLLALYILINIEKVSSPCAKEECVKRNYLQS